MRKYNNNFLQIIDKNLQTPKKIAHLSNFEVEAILVQFQPSADPS